MSGAARMAAAGEFDIADKTDTLAQQTIQEGQLMSQAYTTAANFAERQIPIIQQQANLANTAADVSLAGAALNFLPTALKGVAAIGALL